MSPGFPSGTGLWRIGTPDGDFVQAKGHTAFEAHRAAGLAARSIAFCECTFELVADVVPIEQAAAQRRRMVGAERGART